MAYKHIKIPASGEKIRVNKDFSLSVPDKPIIPYIEGDGTGIDITPVMIKVVDAAVKKAYGGKKQIVWMEMYAGEKSCKVYGENVWLPDDSAQASLRDTAFLPRWSSPSIPCRAGWLLRCCSPDCS